MIFRHKNICFALLLLLFGLFYYTAAAQSSCQPDPPARILLVGDSWSEIMWENKQLRIALDRKGYGDWTEQGERTALTGSTASLWADPAFQAIVRDELLLNPDLQVVVLLTGGNDLLAGRFAAGWYVGQSAQEQLAFFDRTENYIRTIINNIKSTRPGIKILICGYDYINLYNTLNEAANLIVWDNLGQPTPRQLNDALLALEQRKINIANSDPDVYYVQNMGRMQNKYGYSGFFGPKIAPLPGNTAPSYTPLPGGFRDFPTPTVALANNGTDPIHLSDAGYAEICVALYDWFFSPIFKAGVNATYKSSGLSNDGFVKPNNTKSTANFRMGREAAGNYRNIVSFSTGGLPDNAVVTRASIFLTRSASTLIKLPRQLDQMVCQLDIKSGNFGNLTALEGIDYSASASAVNIGCFVGGAGANGAKVRIDVDPTALSFINTKGNTQFRFFINEALSGTVYTSFYDGDVTTTANKPVLEIAYSIPGRTGEQMVRIETESTSIPKNESIFPNPIHSGEALHIQASMASAYILSDIVGKKYISGEITEGDNVIILPADLSPGMYFVSVLQQGLMRTFPIIIAR